MAGKDKILVIGSGGREHALVWKLSQSPNIGQIFVAPGNAGTAREAKATNISLDIKNHRSVIDWCLSEKINLVVVGPEDPLAAGLADDFIAARIKCFGPSKLAAQIESSKAFAKAFMQKHSIPTARWQSFTDAGKAKDYILKATYPAWVVKASGLAAGKGVIVASSKEEAANAAVAMLKDKAFGSASETIVVEECLEGEEISILAFSDGTSFSVMPAAQDHKRLQDGDSGPNTGGMGACCPCPLATDQVMQQIKDEVIDKTLKGLKKDGMPFIGVLYAGLMMTSDGPKVLEFNCRFGDPETQSILPLMESDLYPTLMACASGTLATAQPTWKKGLYSVGVVLVSQGYPGSYPKGKTILGLEKTSSKDQTTLVFHAGTAMQGNLTVTSGGRVLVALALDKDLQKATQRAQEVAAGIKFDGMFYRKDIAAKAVARLKNQGGLTYQDCGVDIVSAANLVHDIKIHADSTVRPGVMGSIGGFGGLFDMAAAGYKDPLLVSGTDGVGTKLKIAHAVGKHDTVGIDLVAMCANDILAQGAEPLFFLDYFACGKLDVGVAEQVIGGISEGCRQANCSLIGGETAEMPGMYAPGDYDLAGFVVGAVERQNVLPRLSDIVEGDVIIGLPSSGVHSNGFSLVRRLVENEGLTFGCKAPYCPGTTLGESLLTPTKIYVRSLMTSIHAGHLKALAHITGGGLLENIPRVLPANCGVELDASQWTLPTVLGWIAKTGKMSHQEMQTTFNCGLGMVLIVSKDHASEVQNLIQATGETAVIIGSVKHIMEGDQQVTVRNFAQMISHSLERRVRKKIGVLISGSGTNLQAMIDRIQDPARYSAGNIALVISNIPNVEGLKRAEKAGIGTKVISHKGFKSRVEFDMAVHAALVEAGVELVCLAGFMRILSAEFVRLWRGRLVNVHPALLPAFKGMHAHRQALEAGARITGCTVHFVEPEVDAGAIILQGAVHIEIDDTEETLVERVKCKEHEIYPEALELLASGRVCLGDDGKTKWSR